MVSALKTVQHWEGSNHAAPRGAPLWSRALRVENGSTASSLEILPADASMVPSWSGLFLALCQMKTCLQSLNLPFCQGRIPLSHRPSLPQKRFNLCCYEQPTFLALHSSKCLLSSNTHRPAGPVADGVFSRDRRRLWALDRHPG